MIDMPLVELFVIVVVAIIFGFSLGDAWRRGDEAAERRDAERSDLPLVRIVPNPLARMRQVGTFAGDPLFDWDSDDPALGGQS